MPAPKAQLLPLTGMRFFLALWVVIFHQSLADGFLGSLLPGLPSPVSRLLGAGNLAVGLFFVLSGFVLSYNHSLDSPWRRPQLIRFAAARFARIYPAYAIGLLLVAPFVAYSLARNFSARRLAQEAATALLNWTLLQAWVPQIALSWNVPGWSLSNEAFFYLCFPFLGVALWRWSRPRSLAAAAFVLCAIAVIPPLCLEGAYPGGFDLASPGSPSPPVPFLFNLLKFNPLLNLPDFCIGILLGRVYQLIRQSNRGLLDRGYWLYVPAIASELLLIAYPGHLPHLFDSLRLPLHALAILGFALGGGTLARALSARPLVFLGNASYAMYIIHVPVVLWMNLIARRLYSTRLGGLYHMLLYVMVVILLSALLFRWIEEPANRLLKRILASRLDDSRRNTAFLVAEPL